MSAASTLATIRSLRRSIQRRAAERARLRAGEVDIPGKVLGLGEFIPRINPRYEIPAHLYPLLRAIERADREPVRVCVSVPPRHGKTESLLAGIVWLLSRDPSRFVAYVSYSAGIARAKSRIARAYVQAAGLKLASDSRGLQEWHLAEGGGMIATGIGGTLTGLGVQMLVVDDPLRNRRDAESPRIRDACYDWFTSTGLTRVEPGGSVFISHTRWHNSDLIGRLKAEDPRWQFVNLPAVGDDGAALWPSRWSLEALREKERVVGPYDWASLFLGSPRPKGMGLFSNPVCEVVPVGGGIRYAIGVDLAYTKNTRSDHSAIVVLGERDGVSWVVEVLRLQVPFSAVVEVLKSTCRRFAGARVSGFFNGPELEHAETIRRAGIPLLVRKATADKFARAQGVAAAWNDGTVRVMLSAPWARAFVDEVVSFPSAEHDDQVDALGSAWDLVRRSPSTGASAQEKWGHFMAPARDAF